MCQSITPCGLVWHRVWSHHPKIVFHVPGANFGIDISSTYAMHVTSSAFDNFDVKRCINGINLVIRKL